LLDVTRTVARRAERGVVGLFQEEKIRNTHILSYLNCVSDILFIMAREEARGKSKAQRKSKTRKRSRKSAGKK
jgi:cob(I)alamin adenosyltransferase